MVGLDINSPILKKDLRLYEQTKQRYNLNLAQALVLAE